MTGVTPNGIRYPDGASKAKNLGAELAQFAEDVDRFIDSEIAAENPAFVAVAKEAAEKAVAADLKARDVVVGGDRRLVDATDRKNHNIRDTRGQSAFGVDSDGNAAFRRSVDLGGAIIKRSRGFKLMDRYRKMAIRVDPDTGTTYIYDPVLVGYEGTGAGAQRLIIDLCAGQSNMEGRAFTTPELDPPDPRHYMYDWASGEIARATTPLSSQHTQKGLSLATVIARQALATEPPGTVVITVNAAVSGSSLFWTADTGKWEWGYNGPVPPLAANLAAAASATIARAKEMFPDLVPTVRMWWHQGEADGTNAEYLAAFTALANGIRNHLGLPDMPIVLGGIVPEYIVANPNRANVRAAQLQVPATITRTAYVDGVSNGGGANPTATVSDIVHYGREGAQSLGKRMYAALQRALVNTAESFPTPPMEVTATRVDGRAYISWTPPMCRVSNYSVHVSSNNKQTWTWLGLTTDTSISVAASSSLWVRVSVYNGDRLSQSSTPILTIGA